MHIYIDADACPVKEEAIRVATRYKLQVTLVSNQGMRPLGLPNVSHKVVGAAFDAADDWIVEQALPGEIVITGDILLAKRCVEKGCHVLKHDRHVYNVQNIGNAVSMRELNSYLREAGEISGHNASFTKKDRSQFLQSLDRVINMAG